MNNEILIIMYFVFAAIFMFLFFSAGDKYNDMIEPLDPHKYLLKAFYPVGFRILELIGYKYESKFDMKRIKDAKIVYGEKYGEYYYRVNVAEKFTYVEMAVTLSPLLGPLTGVPIASLFGIGAGAVLFYYADTKITEVIGVRENEIIRYFPDVVSEMALLINAGMITREAWEAVSKTKDGVLYDEMKQAVVDMDNGASETDAYIAFGSRCNVQIVKKFISMLVQNLSKGNRELVKFLTAEADICWEEKKHLVRRQGEAAANKLMIPLGMIMIGVFVMILVPVVSNMGLI